MRGGGQRGDTCSTYSILSYRQQDLEEKDETTNDLMTMLFVEQPGYIWSVTYKYRNNSPFYQFVVMVKVDNILHWSILPAVL